MSKHQDPWTSQTKSFKEQPAAGQPQEWIQAWAKEVLLEQKRARRGRLLGIFLRGLFTLAILSLVLGSGRLLFTAPDTSATLEQHLAVISIKGTIQDESQASAEVVLKGLRKAFQAPNAQAVVLLINSPGGSPVQAGQIYAGVQDLKQQRPDLPVYAVIEDLGASGGYYVAVAADTILADRASLVGSIGVISGGFGFTEALERLGIERRVFTAGNNKAFLDPFSSMTAEQEKFWQSILDSTHQQFIDRVKEGRGERLAANPEIFSGLVWNGELALAQGLIDELGSIYSLQDQLGVANLVDYTPERNPWQLIEKRLSSALVQAVIQLSAPNY